MSNPEDLPWTQIHRVTWAQADMDLCYGETGLSQFSVLPHRSVSGYFPHLLLLAKALRDRDPKN